MALEIYNTLSKKKEIFKPINGNSVGMYTCGPTVYDYAHIGNYRAYIFADMLKRYLKYCGCKVKHVMNITDVDDKTIRNSELENKSLKEFTEFYTKIFFDDCKMLNIVPMDIYTKATDYIPEMVKIIERLLNKGYAYKTPDGSVYFDIHKDKEYGKLSHFKLSDLKENAEGRLKKDNYDKENAGDFALWKAWDETDGEVFWQTRLGKGRPGWHIECSAMSMSNLGESFDLHTGGVDNIFPHHENEIAQSECATGNPFAKYFMHNEHLLINSDKMSKSFGTYYTLKNLIEKNINPLAFRLWLYTAHYRTKVNFTIDAILASQTALKRLSEAYIALLDIKMGIVNDKYKEKLIACMDNDLDTPKALALFWELAKDTSISDSDKKATMLDFDEVFGFGLKDLKPIEVPENVQRLIEKRNEAKKNKDFAESDKLRKQIEGLGYEINDTADGQQIRKI
jgi:cysteinyl-tRNA synthetase